MDSWPTLKNARVVRETGKAVLVAVQIEGRHESGEAYTGIQNLWFPKAACFQRDEKISVLDEMLAIKEEDLADKFGLSLCGILVEENGA